MDRSIRYEVLEEEEQQQVPAQPVVVAMVVPPPPYPASEQSATANSGAGVEYSGTKLPSYADATTLPSYEEAEQSKQAEALRGEQEDSFRDEHDDLPNNDQLLDLSVGTDGMFICTFVIAFLFNGIGFLLALCITNTVAGRCGALAGLGLSIVKWVVIVKHNNWAEGFAQEDSWLWWVLVICGFLLFVRGAVQYIRVKYEWNRLATHLRRYHFI